MDKLLFLICMLISGISNSQIKALTEEGKEILLFDNGTWKYADDTNDSLKKTPPLNTNKHPFTKSNTATFLIKSKTLNVGMYMDPSKWTFSAPKLGGTELEYQFVMKSKNGYATMITEKTPFALETLRKIALFNAQKAAPNATELSAEYRMVNGKKILCLKIQGTIQDIKFLYFGYYYSNKAGTVQLVTYTSDDLFISVEKEFENFLNGLVEIVK